MAITFAHTNIIATDWKRLSSFYQLVFDCEPVLPERDQSGDWLDAATGIEGAHIRGMHLRLPGFQETGPTLEIYSYDQMTSRPEIGPNTPGFSHIAFAVDNVELIAKKVAANGGSYIGQITQREVPGVGFLTFQYVADPEGNIIEIQKWDYS